MLGAVAVSTVQGGSRVLLGPADLEGMTPEHLWKIYSTLAEENAMLIARLSGKEAEHQLLVTRLQSVDRLQSEVVRLRDENEKLRTQNEELNVRLTTTVEDLTDVRHRLTTMELTLGSREIANQTESKAMKEIFPNCTKRPYSLRSLQNLTDFLEDPHKAQRRGLCMPGALAAWEAMSAEEHNTILQNQRVFDADFPSLLCHIQNLKENGVMTAHQATSLDETIAHFRGLDDDLADGLECCRGYLEK
jgi:hypothetical protein